MLAQLNTLFLSAKFSMWPTELYEINVGGFCCKKNSVQLLEKVKGVFYYINLLL